MSYSNTKIGNWAELKKYCEPIRLVVFVLEQGIPSSLELDGLDEQCSHIVIFNKINSPIATARLNKEGKFGRMAVLKDHRQQGIGSKLLKLLEQQAKELKLDPLYCHAQLSAASFYERNGFVKVGETMQEAGINHIKMIKTLSAAEDTLQ